MDFNDKLKPTIHIIMKSLGILLTVMLSLNALAQTPVNLNIYHKLGAADFAFSQPSQNNNSDNFKLTRMEYYMTKFTIIHDGGMLTAVPDNVISLVKANEQTSIALGSFNVTNIEGVKFHIGVHTPINHDDPGLQPATSPLAFQSPSMHWGWTSGYRFVALEGESGAGMDQLLQLHGLGDGNYLETTIMATANSWNGELYINMDADYDRALENINIASGLVVHAENAEAQVMIGNFHTDVFSASTDLAGVEEIVAEQTSVYPIPSNGSLTVETPSTFVGSNVQIYSLSGRMISDYDLNNGSNKLEISIEESGMFILEFFNGDQKLFSKKVLNN